MTEALVIKTKSLMKTIKRTLPQVRNKQLQKELLYKSLQVIAELKIASQKLPEGESNK